jgi:hypothetical protein
MPLIKFYIVGIVGWVAMFYSFDRPLALNTCNALRTLSISSHLQSGIVLLAIFVPFSWHKAFASQDILQIIS